MRLARSPFGTDGRPIDGRRLFFPPSDQSRGFRKGLLPSFALISRRSSFGDGTGRDAAAEVKGFFAFFSLFVFCLFVFFKFQFLSVFFFLSFFSLLAFDYFFCLFLFCSLMLCFSFSFPFHVVSLPLLSFYSLSCVFFSFFPSNFLEKNKIASVFHTGVLSARSVVFSLLFVCLCLFVYFLSDFFF